MQEMPPPPPVGPPPQVPPAPPKRGGALKIVLIVLGALVGLFIVLGVIGLILSKPSGIDEYADGTAGVAFVSPGGRYSAEFPKQPSTEKVDVPTEVGSLQLVLEGNEGDDGAVHVGYIDYPAEFEQLKGGDLDNVLRSMAQGSASNIDGGKLADSKLTTMLKYRAIDYRIDGDGLVVHARAFFVGRRAYLLQAGSESGGSAQKALARLIRSFKLN